MKHQQCAGTYECRARCLVASLWPIDVLYKIDLYAVELVGIGKPWSTFHQGVTGKRDTKLKTGLSEGARTIFIYAVRAVQCALRTVEFEK